MTVGELIQKLQKFNQHTEVNFCVELKEPYDGAPYGSDLVAELDSIDIAGYYGDNVIVSLKES